MLSTGEQKQESTLPWLKPSGFHWITCIRCYCTRCGGTQIPDRQLRATQVSLSHRTALSFHLHDGDWLILDSKWATSGSRARSSPDVALLPAGQSRLAKKAPTLSRRMQWDTLIFFWSLAIRPRLWKGLWISNKLNLQESRAIKTEQDNLIPALARQYLDATHYKMSCQFWFWEHTPKQVNPSWFVVPQQVKCFTDL